MRFVVARETYHPFVLLYEQFRVYDALQFYAHDASYLVRVRFLGSRHGEIETNRQLFVACGRDFWLGFLCLADSEGSQLCRKSL